jgi:hypothetical protein
MAFGPDGMLYILECHHAGRYDKGTLSKLAPEAFSRLLRGKDGRYRASPEDLTEVYVFGRPGEPSESFDPQSMIAGADGKLYISGHWEHCARFDPKTQSLEWIKYGPERNDPAANNLRDPNYELFNVRARCFAATADGLMWCGDSNEGSPGKIFHTRGGGKDLGGIFGTEQWKYAALGDDSYLYGATDDALIRVKTDGSDINVLHAFMGKNDHPVFAPVLIGNTLFGCAHDEPRSGSGQAKSGYLYKLNSDGRSGYSKIVDLAYDPERPLIRHGDSLYGMAPDGLFTLSVNQPMPKIIAPTKERKETTAMVVENGAAYVLMNPNGVDSFILRIPVPGAAASERQPVATATGTGSAVPAAATATEVAASGSPPPGPTAPVPGGKNVFHKRQSGDSQGAESASVGSSSNAVDEGLSASARPGLPPRQSKAPAQVSSSVAPTTGDTAPPPADGTTGVATSNPAPPALAAPVPGGKSVFHKRLSSDDSQGAPPDADGASAGTSPTAGDEGLSAKPRPGLPPRQSRTPAKVAAASPSAESENSFASTEQPSTGWGSSSPSAQQPSSRTSRRSTEGNEGDVSDSSAGADDVSAFVERQMQAMSAQDMETLVSLYGDNVDYLDKGVVSNDAIRNDLQQYFDRFPVTQWQVADAVSSKQLAGGNYQIRFPVTFDVSNPSTGKHITGVALQTEVIATDSAGNMKIISRHEKVTSSRGSSDKPKKQRPARERVYQGRPVIPIPPNIPWPPGLPRP